MTTLLYIADPMCSWCYGFAPQLGALLESLPELPMEVMVGGLRAYQETPIDTEQKEKLLAHWRQAQEASGLPIREDMLSQHEFIYNTEPACRAVVAARLLSPQAAWPVFQAIQHAFYAEGRDVTNGKVLAEIGAAAVTASGTPVEADAFLAKWSEPSTMLATHSEFEQVRKWGVTGFPTVVLERSGELNLVTSGFLQMPELVEKLQEIVDQQDGTEPAKAEST